ncbi:site-specific integrase [Burkholderia ubonensis]|uniref:site-specific integrase n=1 Tax=Burkholderia ubonensis TaxID=101571 RepID=UPI000A7443EC|nr:site-specific integrase [Burkholderia ubonensis]
MAYRAAIPITASVFDLRCENDSSIAILVVDEPNGTPRIVPEVVSLQRMLLSSGASFAKMRGVATTLALLHDYVRIVWRDRPISHQELPEIISGFLRKRRRGSDELDGLQWPPVKRETIDRDKLYIREASDFFSLQYGYFPLIPFEGSGIFARDTKSYRAAMRELFKKTNSLLAHLALRNIQTTRRPIVDIQERRAFRRTYKRSGPNTFMPLSMVEDIIHSTPSIVQKMAFTQAAFGGSRASEMLNMWRCDVLPGMYRPHLFPDDKSSDLPLLVLAHPSQSRYIGEVYSTSIDRTQFLADKYRLRPRNLMDTESVRAGWKGILFDNDELLISQIFWCSKSWALAYWNLFTKFQDDLIYNIPKSVRMQHPYLYVNDCNSRREYGHPLKISNLRKAFSRACKRIGADERRYKAGIHGFRHTYKATLEKLGLSPEEIRIAMHHVSIDSQRDYGRSAAALNQRLSQSI